MYPYETFEIPYKGNNIVEPLTASAQLDDFIWLLDQCGFDEHVRAMPHKDIFLSMRQKLLGQEYKWDSGIEQDILMNFINVDKYSFTEYSGHAIAHHLLKCLWRGAHGYYYRVNLIEYKIQKISQGSAPIYPTTELILPKEVTDEGSRIALLMMLKTPQDFKEDYIVWAQKQAFYEHLHGLHPQHLFVKEKLDENTNKFKSLYRKTNRKRNNPRGYRQPDPAVTESFYKNLHKYSYGKKCSIIRCLLEPDLAA